MRSTSNTEVDVVVVGAGPAGNAAATCCAGLGLRTMVVEREPFPRDRPGESLHALADQLFKQLGVHDRVRSRRFVRQTGAWIAWRGAPTFTPYESLGTGVVHGFQAPGEVLDSILLQRVRDLGVVVLQPTDALDPLVEDGRVCGITTASGIVRARWVVDAGGRRHWLARRLDIPIDRTSPPLLAHFGYATGSCPTRDDAPLLQADGDGWTWTARIGEDRYHWTRLSWNRTASVPDRPAEFAGLDPLGPTRAIDVTWRSVRAPAGAGYRCIGDAAALVDPAGMHGVVRALISGILVAEQLSAVAKGTSTDEQAAERHNAWVTDGFAKDTAGLRARYRAVATGDVWSAATLAPARPT